MPRTRAFILPLGQLLAVQLLVAGLPASPAVGETDIDFYRQQIVGAPAAGGCAGYNWQAGGGSCGCALSTQAIQGLSGASFKQYQRVCVDGPGGGGGGGGNSGGGNGDNGDNGGEGDTGEPQ